jgi:hypothetical protein
MPTLITLRIQAGEEIPSFKNSKMIARIKGRPALITAPRKAAIMELAIQSIESQLRCWLQTQGIETETGPIPPSRIASFMPLDDSLKWIPEHCVRLQRVKRGEEGAMINIERLCQ